MEICYAPVNYRTSDDLAKGYNFLLITEYEQIIKSSDVPPEVGFGKLLLEQVRFLISHSEN